MRLKSYDASAVPRPKHQALVPSVRGYERKSGRRKLAVDPGLHSCGWAVFEGPAKLPLGAGLVHPTLNMGYPLIDRAASVATCLYRIAREWDTSLTWIEMPVSYGDIDPRAGSIFKLCVCIGVIAATLNDRSPVEAVEVPEWKGQLPKAVVERRIHKILGEKECKRLGLKADMWDAVGIGLYKQGFFK